MNDKNDIPKQIVLGIVVPVAILGLIFFNLVTQTVYLPRRRKIRLGLLVGLHSWPCVIEVVLLKLAVAIYMLGSCWFANRKEWEHLAAPTCKLALVIGSIGLLVIPVHLACVFLVSLSTWFS